MLYRSNEEPQERPKQTLLFWLEYVATATGEKGPWMLSCSLLHHQLLTWCLALTKHSINIWGIHSWENGWVKPISGLFCTGWFLHSCASQRDSETWRPSLLPIRSRPACIAKTSCYPLKQTKEYLALRLEDFVMLRCNTKLMLLVFFSFLRMLNSVHVGTFIQFFKEHWYAPRSWLLWSLAVSIKLQKAYGCLLLTKLKSLVLHFLLQ